MFSALKRLLLLWIVGAAACADGRVAASDAELQAAAGRAQTDSAFARLIERLSEPGGYFDTDNLISNEASYLHVLGEMRELGVQGGAYIGVGPDQNFSYIAELRPTIAFIIDIRRDNLLQHLLFKSLFVLSRNRVEYLSLLFGRPPPEDAAAWRDRSLGELLNYIDATPAEPETIVSSREAVEAELQSFGVPLSPADLETINGFHTTFMRAGLSLRFTSHNRPPRPYYPTYRQLLLEKDLTGRQASYLGSEDHFQLIKSMQANDLIVPVVGDLAGQHALVAIGREVAARGEHVSAFYTSNVEFYLMRDGSFDRFADNLSQLPSDERSVIIRSYFGGVYRTPHPQAVPGYYSTQLLQTIESLVERYESGGYGTYWELVAEPALQPR